MAQKSTFDRLVSGLSADERLEMLKGIEAANQGIDEPIIDDTGESEPVILIFKSWKQQAKVNMPIPPIPTKWTCLTFPKNGGLINFFIFINITYNPKVEVPYIYHLKGGIYMTPL